MTSTPAIDRLAVVIPAANEQDGIGAALGAVETARSALARIRPGLRVRTVVALDHCTDATAEVVAHFPDVSAIALIDRCVGAARAAGTAHALAGLARTDPHTWTAHTDADSRVPADWLVRMVAAAENGADVVLGTVQPDVELPEAVRRAWRRAHQLTDGHPHVFGANLGIRASTLAACGGWPIRASGEDVELVARAELLGAQVSRLGDPAVLTSARPDGRAPEGFSSYLRALSRRLSGPVALRSP